MPRINGDPRRRKTGRFHVCVGLGIIERMAKEGKSAMDEVDTETGERRELTPTECSEEVARLREKGYEVVPPCDNHDKRGFCLGHPLKR